MNSVKEFARNILKHESQIHVLQVNNAVFLYRKRSWRMILIFDAATEINYLGHYLLLDKI